MAKAGGREGALRAMREREYGGLRTEDILPTFLREEAAKQLTLPELAQAINEHHGACERAYGSALDHARVAGELLRQAKERTPVGEWGAWLGRNFAGKDRTAQVYMRIAVHWNEVQKAQRVADSVLGIGDTQRLLAEPKELAREREKLQRTEVVSEIDAAIREGASPADAVTAAVEKVRERVAKKREVAAPAATPVPVTSAWEPVADPERALRAVQAQLVQCREAGRARIATLDRLKALLGVRLDREVIAAVEGMLAEQESGRSRESE